MQDVRAHVSSDATHAMILDDHILQGEIPRVKRYEAGAKRSENAFFEKGMDGRSVELPSVRVCLLDKQRESLLCLVSRTRSRQDWSR